MTTNASDRLRVCHVIHSLGAGGAEQVLTDLARVAPEAGMDLTVVALSPVEEPVHAMTLRNLGVEVVELELSRGDPRAAGRLIDVANTAGTQIIHTHLKHADVVGAMAARRLRIPVVSTLHVIEDSGLSVGGRLKRRIGSAVRGSVAARTIAVSHAQRDWYLRQTKADPASVVVLHNGVAAPAPLAVGERAAIRRELGAGPSDLVALYAALMRPEKGHHVLLDAMRMLPHDVPVLLALAGDGPLRAELENRILRDPDQAQWVRFLGYRNDVPRLLAGADLAVHPTLADALPTTLIQALAAGVPAVASDVGGVSEVVGPDAGILVPPDDAAALAGALTTVARSASTRAEMGAAARERFAAEFDSLAWAHKLMSLYEEVRSAPVAA